MSVKGLELPAYDPRGAYGMALAYCTSNRGGCHLRAYPISHEILRKPIATDRFSFSGKARIIAIAEDTNAAVDSLVACKFSFFGASWESTPNFSTATTGRVFAQALRRSAGASASPSGSTIGANGFDLKDDLLPERFYSEAGSSGEGIEIPPIERARFDEELQKYYRIRGLTQRGRLPTQIFCCSSRRQAAHQRRDRGKHRIFSCEKCRAFALIKEEVTLEKLSLSICFFLFYSCRPIVSQ